MLTIGQSTVAADEAPARLVVAPRTHVEPRRDTSSADHDHPPVVAVPTTPGELVERLDELLVDATDPESWEAVLAGCVQWGAAPDIANVVTPLVGQAREAYGRGIGGVWYLDPEHDAARLVLALAGRPVTRRAPTWGWADHRRRRVDEVLDVLADRRDARLAATPSDPEGRLDPMVFAERLTHGAGIGDADRHQARLRMPGGHARPGRWEVRAERSRQGTLVTLIEIGGPEGHDSARFWPGLGDPPPGGAQRVPTREADLLRWASPHEADRFDAWAAERLARNIDWWEADWEERRLFTRLRTTHAVPGLPGRVLLAVGLGAKQPTAHQPAVAVTRRLLDAGLLGPRRFAETLGQLAGVLDPERLARTLGALRHSHPHAVASMLDGALPVFDRGDRRLAALVGLYADTVEQSGAPAVTDRMRGWLAGVPQSLAVAAAAARALEVADRS